MDSSNSGSFQSSSGGAAGDNEEYDSTTHSISSFLNPSNHFNPTLDHLLHPPPPPPSSSSPPPSHHHLRHPPPTYSTFSPKTNPLQGSSPAWTETILPVRQDQNLTGFGTLYPNINPNPSTTDTKTNMGHESGYGSGDHHQIGVAIKNPKKRTRASRRAPTTVLTTDTTNFRQMVQEFTGIPTSPFTAAPFSSRLDLFRPTAQKIQQQVLNPTANNNITASTSSSSYHLPPSNIYEFQTQPSTLLDLQNPMLSFQSLLQTSLPQQSNDLKRWRGQDEKLESFEGSKMDSGLENVVITSRSGGDDQVQGTKECRGF